MKSLYKYIKEEGEGGAGEATAPSTPGNTMGMGNPMMPGGSPNTLLSGPVGSGDTFIGKKTAKLKKKQVKKQMSSTKAAYDELNKKTS